MIEATEIFNTTNALYWSTNENYHYYVQASNQCIANEIHRLLFHDLY